MVCIRCQKRPAIIFIQRMDNGQMKQEGYCLHCARELGRIDHIGAARQHIGKKYFSVASGGGTGRTLHPDNVAAGPASYGLTDSMGRMHGDAQFAGSSSVPAHVEMMGLIGAGNNPMVGMTVACAVAASQVNA